MKNSKKKFTPNYNPISLKEIANAVEFSKTHFWRWRKKKKINLPRGKVNFANQKMIYLELYGEEYVE